MKNLFKFLFLIISFSIFGIGTPTASAAPPCTHVSFAFGPSSGTIVQVGGSYYYRITVNNSGTQFTSAIDITVATTQFTVANLPSQVIGTGNVVLDFPITSNVATITTGGGFGVVTTLTFPGGTPAPCDVSGPVILSTAGWGCTDPSALNYDPAATFDNNSCLETICDLFTIANVEIVYNTLGVPVLEITIVNNSTYSLGTSTTATINITSSSPVFGVYSGPYIIDMLPGGYKVIECPITSPISNLVGPLLLITGNITVNAPDVPDLCQIDFNGFPIDISNLGCTDATAFNYDQYATVDNESCVSDIVVAQNVIQPICEGDPGAVSFTFSGGTPGYTVDYGLQDPDYLLPGTYVFTVTDDTDPSIGGPITQQIEVTIDYPPSYEVIIYLLSDNTTLEAAVNGSITGWYYWLLDGVVVDSTQVPYYVYTTPGTYTCYVETPVNALGQQCWDYSNGLILTQIGTEEYNKQGLSVFPNPSNGTFSVNIDNFTSNTVYAQIFDIQGKEVYRYTSDGFDGQLIFDELNLQSGLYQIRIENGESLYRAKIVVE